MNVKQVIVIRRDLKMRRGKEIAQGSHASMLFLTHLLAQEGVVPLSEKWFKAGDGEAVELTPELKEWVGGSFTKVCARVDSEQELLELHEKAKANGLLSFIIQDNGTTEFGGIPTYTALAIGPNASEEIDTVTRDLKLY